MGKKIEFKANKRGMEDVEEHREMQGGPLFLCNRHKKRNEERDAHSRKIYLSEGRKCNSGQDRHGRNREKEKIKTGQSLGVVFNLSFQTILLVV